MKLTDKFWTKLGNEFFITIGVTLSARKSVSATHLKLQEIRSGPVINKLIHFHFIGLNYQYENLFRIIAENRNIFFPKFLEKTLLNNVFGLLITSLANRPQMSNLWIGNNFVQIDLNRRRIGNYRNFWLKKVFRSEIKKLRSRV